MKKRRKAPARVLAVLALVATVVAVMAVISSSSDDGGKQDRSKVRAEKVQQKNKKADEKKNDEKQPAVYVVQTGDTLSSIADEFGLTVEELQELNPGIDPQILSSGATLKLR